MEPILDQPTPEPAANKQVITLDMDDARDTASKASFWLIGIGILSFVNAFLIARGSYFVMGLAITQIIDSVVLELTGHPNYYISRIIPALFVILGIFGIRLSRTAFIIGALLYLFDTILFVLFREWIAIAIHAFILYKLFKGFQSVRQYHSLKKQL